jgi:type IV pilus assembly protein PilN
MRSGHAEVSAVILINLLPHRELARKRKLQIFQISLGLAAVAGLLIAGVVYLWFQGQILDQQSRNTILTQGIKRLDDQIKDVASLQDQIAALKARQTAVENLQADRNLPVFLLSEAVQQLPDGIYLRGIKQDNQNILFTGTAQSNERVSELLRNLSRNSEWITRPELIEIVASNIALSPKDQRRVYNFTVRAHLQRASDVAKAAAAASDAAKSAAKPAVVKK